MQIIDASIIVKLCIEENGSAIARQVVAQAVKLSAPNHALAEVGEVLARKVRLGQARFEQVSDAIGAVALRIDFIDLRELLPAAMTLSLDTRLSVYDCLYVAAAERLRGQLFTADQRMLNLLQPMRYRSLLLPLDSSTGSP
jgi:predicted nucleic acid-binding protein